MSGAIQLGLFDLTIGEPPRASSYPHVPGFKSSGASQEAAQHVAGAASRLRADVLAELRRWPAGATADQVAASMQRSPLSVRPRVAELKAMGKITATGERRRNESGMSASVWKAVA